jgi:hypothetical protein
MKYLLGLALCLRWPRRTAVNRTQCIQPSDVDEMSGHQIEPVFLGA